MRHLKTLKVKCFAHNFFFWEIFSKRKTWQLLEYSYLIFFSYLSLLFLSLSLFKHSSYFFPFSFFMQTCHFSGLIRNSRLTKFLYSYSGLRPLNRWKTTSFLNANKLYLNKHYDWIRRCFLRDVQKECELILKKEFIVQK